MKYLYILFILASCAAPASQDKEKQGANSQKKWEYKLQTYSDDGVEFTGTLHLPDRMCEKEFRELLMDLRKGRLEDYEKIGLSVYLDLEFGEVEWATVHFIPNLRLNITGLTIDEVNSLTNYSFPIRDAEIHGEWMAETRIITIYKTGSETLVRFAQINGEIIDEYEIEEGEDVSFVEAFEEPMYYFILEKNGNLRLGEFGYDGEDDIVSAEIETLDNFKKANKYLPCKK